MKLRLTALALAGILAGCANVQAIKPTVYKPVPQTEFIPYYPEHVSEPIPTLEKDYNFTPAPSPIPPIVIVKPKPVPTIKLVGKNLTGVATYYCRKQDYHTKNCMARHPDGGLFAAAGPSLRKALGSNWRGTILTVCNTDGICVAGVVLADWCGCPDNHPIDLYADVFSQLAPLYLGRAKVVIKW